MSFGPVGLDSGVPHGGLAMYSDRHPALKTDAQLRKEDEQRVAEMGGEQFILDHSPMKVYTELAHNKITSYVTDSGFFKCDVWAIIGCDKRPDWWPKPAYQRADIIMNEKNSTEEREAEAISYATDSAFAAADIATVGTATEVIVAARTGLKESLKIASEKGVVAMTRDGAEGLLDASIEAGNKPIRTTLKGGLKGVEYVAAEQDIELKTRAVQCEDESVFGLNLTAAGISNKFARAAGGCDSFNDWLPSEEPENTPENTEEPDVSPQPAPGPLERKMPQTVSGVKAEVDLDPFLEQGSPLVLPIVLASLLLTLYIVRKF